MKAARNSQRRQRYHRQNWWATRGATAIAIIWTLLAFLALSDATSADGSPLSTGNVLFLTALTVAVVWIGAFLILRLAAILVRLVGFRSREERGLPAARGKAQPAKLAAERDPRRRELANVQDMMRTEYANRGIDLSDLQLLDGLSLPNFRGPGKTTMTGTVEGDTGASEQVEIPCTWEGAAEGRTQVRFPLIAPTPEQRRRKPIPREVRRAVWERDGGRCVECGATFELQYDHIIPWSKGGGDSVDNLQLLCLPCNVRKRDHI